TAPARCLSSRIRRNPLQQIMSRVKPADFLIKQLLTEPMPIKRIFKSIIRQANTRRLRSVFRAHPKLLLCFVGLCLLSISLGVLWVRDQAERGLAQERARLSRQEFIPFEKSSRSPLSRPEIKFLQNTENTRAIVRFQDS